MNIVNATVLLKKDLSKFLGFNLPNTVGAGLQFYNIASEFADRVRAAEMEESATSASDNKQMETALRDIANLICDRDNGHLSYSELVRAIGQRLNVSVE